MSLLEDIISYFKSEGLIEGDGVDAFRDFKPESPDNIVSLHEYKGDPISPYTDVVHRSVQVLVRNSSATAAKELANKLFSSLRKHDGAQRINLTGERWGQIHLRQAPFKISQDEKNRTHYGFNLGITTITD